MASFKKVEVVANCASGSVGAAAPGEIAKLISEFGIDAKVRAPEPANLIRELRAAVDAAPDLLVVLAGDGTARAAAELCGPTGPIIAPLPGGTMNMLPRAIYGARSWQDALRLALEQGVERRIGGGQIEGRTFLVAAILGSPARWAQAREAARRGSIGLAVQRARTAFRRTFTGRLRYALDGGQREKAEALLFMCALTSRALDNDVDALEAAAFDVRGVSDILRVGLHALAGDWRALPSVETTQIQRGYVWSPRGVPALLDGELVRLPTLSEVRYCKAVARILAIPAKDLA